MKNRTFHQPKLHYKKIVYSRRKLGQNRWKKFIYVGFSQTSVGQRPMKISVIPVVLVLFQFFNPWLQSPAAVGSLHLSQKAHRAFVRCLFPPETKTKGYCHFLTSTSLSQDFLSPCGATCWLHARPKTVKIKMHGRVEVGGSSPHPTSDHQRRLRWGVMLIMQVQVAC
jgi:hypothetical protein